MATNCELNFHDPNPNYLGANIHNGDASEDSARGTPLQPMTSKDIQDMENSGRF